MTPRQHIAVLSTSFPDEHPGSEAAGSFVADFAEALAEYVSVTVIAPSRIKKADERRGNLSIRRFTVPHLPLSLLKPGNPLHLPSIFRTLHAGQDAVQRVVREKKVDHILALWALPSGYWARNVWKSHGIPYSTWALGSDIWSFGKIPIMKMALAAVLKDSHVCFADGYRLKQDVERMSGRCCEFLASSRNLPVVRKKSLSAGPPYKLAFLGRWHRNKGVDLLIESLKMLGDDDWRKIEEVRIYGGGPLEGVIKPGCESLRKIGRPVTVGGYLNKSEAAELLTWADYLFLPSRKESIPVVFSDAMQAGCPVIATPVGDLPSLFCVNNVGVLAAATTSSSFAAATREALNTPAVIYCDGMERTGKLFNLNQTAERFIRAIF